MSIVMAISLASGRRKSTTSSAYREIRCCKARLNRGCSISSSAALVIMCPRISITKMKSIGDNGSPCLNPRR
uniref:Uncharacterized protein n=1 Tax=Arundo donax TaxID=35708 RepID=A0A0A9BAN7_ARUDO